MVEEHFSTGNSRGEVPVAEVELECSEDREKANVAEAQ